jgi:methionyl-tRNA formyltransferase
MEKVQPEGKKPMPALDFLNGARLKPGDMVCTH